MTLRTILIALLVLVLAGTVLALVSGSFTLPAPEGGVACTEEAKQCPDGSYVGRTEPNCEFAACPTATTTPTPNETSTMLHASIGQKVTGLDVSLTPLTVTSDSRCPVDVQCVWAGTVQVKVHIESGLGPSDMTFDLGKPITTEAEEITLTEVSPAKSAGMEIPVSSYQFTFEIRKR